MSTCILTSMFPNGFDDKASEMFRRKIDKNKRNKFAFVASEFEKTYEKNDSYFTFFLNMFEEKGICFKETYVVDGRMSPEQAQDAVANADVVWLSGGDTPTQFRYFQKYGLETVIKRHKGMIIGMSAGSINMAKTAVCTVSCGHTKQNVYQGLGCVDISVEPHFDRDHVSEEVLDLSNKYTIYGLCDDSMIAVTDDVVEFYGEIYKLSHGCIELIHE